MKSTFEAPQFGNGNRRRVTLHSFDGLPIHDRLTTAFGTSKAAIEHMGAWSNLKGLSAEAHKTTMEGNNLERFHPTEVLIYLMAWTTGKTCNRLAFLDEEHSCSLCINTMESAEHLYFACPFSDYVWSHIRQWLSITRRMSTLYSAVKWLKKEKMGSSMQNKARTLALACTVYSLWRHRNEIIFEGKAPNPDGLIACIKITVCRIIFALYPYGF
ncbi:hypothetical protein Salat_1143800 [Sesamum alatum]|uniref:Reverse transcriptase zinc-binding domain-containing protein n=1 Tax=Sesamum alatum TaxID=300844 RepID=A0AAE1YE90_9LAMI|nr:hypothetical protein Salat_1143800 [Sesamum alatum]